MTRYMLDTNTVTHLLKKHPAVARRVVAVPITALCILAITQGELQFGLAKRPDAIALHEAVRELLRRVDVLPWEPRPRSTDQPEPPLNARAGRLRRWISSLVHTLSASRPSW
jgi:hypothetical protein